MAVPVPARRAEVTEGAITIEYPGKMDARRVLEHEPGRYIAEPSTEHPNRLYHDDNLRALAHLAQDLEVAGKVTLAYIDPPFATNGHFHSRRMNHAFSDDLTGAAFVEALRHRLIFIHRLLSSRGSLYLHLDSKMVHHMRVVLDEVFGAANFRGFIARRKCSSKNYTRKTYGNIADYILFYSKTDDYAWNRPMTPWTPEASLKEYPYVDANGRRHKRVPIHAPGVRNGLTGKPWRGKMPPPGKHWQYRPETLDELDARGDIYWSRNGNPRRKVYLDESPGSPVQDMWMDMRDAHNQNVKVTGYPTEKNLELLERVVEASSNPGDLVLDCYSGSGTTLAAAARLGRRWIGVDSSDEAIQATLRRLRCGRDRMGDYVNADAQRTLPIMDREPVDNFGMYSPAP